jgi:hypothetical protein
MPNNSGIKINTKAIERELNRQLSKVKVKIPVQADVNYRSDSSIRPTYPLAVTHHNYDNRGAIIGAIGNDNIINQSLDAGISVKDVLDLIADMRTIVKNSDIDLNDKMDLAILLNEIKGACESNAPNKSQLSETVTSIGIKVAGTSIAATLKPYIGKVVEWLKNSNILTLEQCAEVLNVCNSSNIVC